MKKVILIVVLLISGVNWVYSQNECPPTVVDIDGNDYSTVMIGTQCWMAQNMRASHDRNGNDIPLGNKLSYTVPYLYLNVSGVTACGYLYNWTAAMRVCPKGWHLPTNTDWTQLTDYVSAQPQYCCGGRENYIAKHWQILQDGIIVGRIVVWWANILQRTIPLALVHCRRVFTMAAMLLMVVGHTFGVQHQARAIMRTIST